MVNPSETIDPPKKVQRMISFADVDKPFDTVREPDTIKSPLLPTSCLRPMLLDTSCGNNMGFDIYCDDEIGDKATEQE